MTVLSTVYSTTGSYCVNTKKLTSELSDLLRAELRTLTTGTDADLKIIAEQIAPQLVEAAVRGDKDLTKELEAQIKGIVAVHKIRAARSINATVIGTARIALKALTIGLTGI
jgi:hypothetical protein